MNAKSFLMGGACAVPVLQQADQMAGNSQYGKALNTEYGEFDGGYHINVIEGDMDIFSHDFEYKDADGYPLGGYVG